MEGNIEGTKETKAVAKIEPTKEGLKIELIALEKEVKELQLAYKNTREAIYEGNKRAVGWGEEALRLKEKVQKIQDGRKRKRKTQDDSKVDESSKKGGGRMDPLLVFPEEIWDMILGNVTDPQDMKNCSKTCQLFQKLLRPRRTVYLFDLILPHICKKWSMYGVLLCRSVCKAWKSALDNLMEDHPSLRPFDELTHNPKNPPFTTPFKIDGMGLYVFTNGHEDDLRAKDFIGQMGDHPQNPFLGRAVSIWVTQHYRAADVDDDNAEPLPHFLLPEANHGMPLDLQVETYWDSVYSFLETFGQHIWYLSISSINPSHCERMVPLVTRDVFRLVPNLRRLRISGQLPTVSEESDVAKKASANSLPVLAPKLETLEIYDIFREEQWSHPMLETLLQTFHPQLRRLHIKWTTWVHIAPFQFDWSSLVDLHIDGLNREEMDISPLTGAKLGHLKKLALSPGPDSDDWSCRKKYDFQTVMQIVMELSSSNKGLQVLKIFVGFDHDCAEEAPRELLAPISLKTLEVEIDDNLPYVWFRFLLRFPFLENVNVFVPKNGIHDRFGFEVGYRKLNYRRLGYHDIHDIVASVRSHMLEGCMYDEECDIWKVLPRLKVFTFQRDVYTRKGYEQSLVYGAPGNSYEPPGLFDFRFDSDESSSSDSDC